MRPENFSLRSDFVWIRAICRAECAICRRFLVTLFFRFSDGFLQNCSPRRNFAASHPAVVRKDEWDPKIPLPRCSCFRGAATFSKGYWDLAGSRFLSHSPSTVSGKKLLSVPRFRSLTPCLGEEGRMGPVNFCEFLGIAVFSKKSVGIGESPHFRKDH